MMTTFRILLSCLIALAMSNPLFAKTYDLASPNGKIKAAVTFNETAGTLSYQVTSGETAILAESPLGILTDKAKFTDGLKLLNTARAKIDETYTLPHGKVSTYYNKANELPSRWPKTAGS